MTTKIEWTNETWNPVTGCSKVSQGCKNCYAERLWPKVAGAEAARTGQPRRAFTDVRCHPERLDTPLHWRTPRRIFVNSMSDLFHEDVPFSFVDEVFGVMAITTRHSFQILTKRPTRMHKYITGRTAEARSEQLTAPGGLIGCPDCIVDAAIAARHRTRDKGYDNCGPLWPLKNVWLGVSVEDQATADERIPLLLQTPAAVRFISAEPLLGPITFEGRWVEYKDPRIHENQLERLHWVITGGESGPNARPTHPDWIRQLRDQCAAAGVPFFFKQWGEHVPGALLKDGRSEPWRRYQNDEECWNGNELDHSDIPEIDFLRCGKKRAGRRLDGREHSEYPA